MLNRKLKKKLLLVIAVIVVAYIGYDQRDSIHSATPESDVTQSQSVLADAFGNRRSDVQVQGKGKVTKVLSDDNAGSRHQRFIIRLDSGQTIFIAHNIDLAPRIPNLQQGDMVEFNGEYEWNAKGGVVHWTHHDPAGRHPGGWLKHNGQTFQ